MNRDSNPGNQIDNDESLIERIMSGDKLAFDILVPRYKDKIFNLCYRFSGDYTEADDLTQETFIKVYLSVKHFRFESSFSTWIYRIAINVCKNRINSLPYRFKRLTNSLSGSKDTEREGLMNDVADNSPAPDCEFEEKERKKIIQKAINKLPKDQMKMIILRDIEGLSYEEIAGITRCNLGTVKSKLARARFSLKEKLKGLIR
ncbi:MAG: sigma-70 family RNA polymerase sigma factor [bacterium]